MKVFPISKGGLAATIVDIRIILKIAIDNLASGIILAHNHPSGNPQPSESDKSLTKNIKEAARHMDILVLDHIIVAGNTYFSFADADII